MPATRSSLTEGPILKSLVSLSLPIVFANVLQSMYQLTDTFWVGRLGGNAVAAVSVSFPLIFLMIALGGGFTVAGSTLVAQYTGAKNSKMVNHVTSQTLMIVFFAAACLSLLGFLSSGALLRLIGVEKVILGDATTYLRVSFSGLIFLFGYFMYQSIMRGLGEVRVPLYIVSGTVLLNLLLDPLFIFGWGPIPGSGVSGAAYATIGTQSIAMLTGFCVLFSGRYGIHFRLAGFRPDFGMMKRILKLGLPASIEQSTRALGMSMMIFLVAGFGTLTVAIFGIGSRILSFVIIPALGLSMATATLVGQNIGAGNLPRANSIARLSALVAFAALTVVGILCFCFAQPLIRFFVPSDEAVVSGAVIFLKTMALFFGLIGAQQALIGAFRGSGNTFMSMMLAIVSMWVFQFPLAYILSRHTGMGPRGIWWTYPIANFLSTAVTLAWFLQGSWQKKRITEEAPEETSVSEEIITQEGLR
ncbi:MATE family efflux transporter [Luteolibacter pohnpeiensis]|uniref:MATE family efflux transporter n=1 Tax=Luteolibacter pohnpeiensis TaxID=454153 RepID=A0A934VW37_9BACT|nr:MATE family efflux transporter [Luteolibacter pohnpeiensis]MBK1882109.1 MATE family efflux transporter [Luteolibacter pohnpeiensis]